MKVETGAGGVSARRDGPARPEAVFVLGNGAGAGMTSEFMEFFATRLAARGLGVWRFDFPYQEQGRKSPDRAPVLEEVFTAVARAAAEDAPEAALVLGGKSMGGRIASQLVAAGFDAQGLVFLGYPLHPPGKPERIRDRHLYDIKAPMLFVEGTRDPFCPLETLERVRARLASSALFVVEGGDHSLSLRKLSGRSTAEAWSDALVAIERWVRAEVLRPEGAERR